MRKLTLIGIFALSPFVASAEDAMPTDTTDEVVIVEESADEAPEVIVVEDVPADEVTIEEITVD